jgi:hypothetical protein
VALALKGRTTLPFGVFFAAFRLRQLLNAFLIEKARHESC